VSGEDLEILVDARKALVSKRHDLTKSANHPQRFVG
jgi:hypothetical protein